MRYFSMDKTDFTLNYYNQNSASFVKDTKDVSLSSLQQEFLSYIPKGGTILDLGCGSGRDSKAFVEQGYVVEAVDGSQEMCKVASEYIGQEVICARFQDYKPNKPFDGIWACASLLHLERGQVGAVLRQLSSNLRKGGCFYASFKYGSFEGERNGRYFTDLTEESFASIIQNIPELKIAKTEVTQDVRPNRTQEKWLNLFLIKR